MKREEEIVQVADRNYSDYSERRLGFIAGVKWADKTILDNACEWLESKLNYVESRIGDPVVCSFDYETIYEFITAFRQAMQGDVE